MTTFLFCISLAVNVHGTVGTHLFMKDKDYLPQYQFRKTVQKIENPTLLMYKYQDAGFYTSCNIVPSCRYFCRLNIWTLTEMFEEQDRYVNEGLTDFIITNSKKPDAVKEFELYTFLESSSIQYEDNYMYYYLYRKNDILPLLI